MLTINILYLNVNLYTDWLHHSASSPPVSWCVVGVLVHYGCRRIIQVDAAHWWWMRRYVKRFECLEKRYINVTNNYRLKNEYCTCAERNIVSQAAGIPLRYYSWSITSRYYWLYWSIVQGKCPGWRGEGHRWFFQLCSLEGLAACCTTVPAPDSDAAGQHVLNGSPVESGEGGWRETCSFQPAEKVLALLRLLGEWCSVGGPGEVLCDVHPQEFSAADSLHSRAVDGQWGVVRVSPEVHHNLLCLTHIEGQVVVLYYNTIIIFDIAVPVWYNVMLWLTFRAITSHCITLELQCQKWL